MADGVREQIHDHKAMNSSMEDERSAVVTGAGPVAENAPGLLRASGDVVHSPGSPKALRGVQLSIFGGIFVGHSALRLPDPARANVQAGGFTVL